MYLNNNIQVKIVYSHRFLLCVDCLENESMSSCCNPHQIQICISYISTFFTTSSQYSVRLKNPWGWVKYYCFVEMFVKFKENQVGRNLSTFLHVNSLLKNAGMNLKFQIIDSIMESLGVRLTWLDCTTQIWLLNLMVPCCSWPYTMIALCQCYCNNNLLCNFALS